MKLSGGKKTAAGDAAYAHHEHENDIGSPATKTGRSRKLNLRLIMQLLCPLVRCDVWWLLLWIALHTFVLDIRT
jgi:hypothetical protein